MVDRPITRSPWTRWTRPTIIAGVVLIAAIWAGVTLFGSTDRTLRVKTSTLLIGTAEQAVFHDFIPLRGRVVPYDTIYLDALEGGQIKRRLVEAGDQVTEGQPMIELRNTELELDVRERVARLLESQAQLEGYETQLELNRLNNEKDLASIDYNLALNRRLAAEYTALGPQGGIPEETRQNVLDALAYYTRLRPIQAGSNKVQEETRLRELPKLRDSLVKLDDDLKATRAKLDNLVVRAPVTGLVTAMDLKVGEMRNRGDRLAELTPDTGIKVAADVDEFYLGRVQKGQTASVEVSAKTWQLTVTRVYPQVVNGQFKVDLIFVGASPAGLLPGQAILGKLALGADVPALIIPVGSFVSQTGGDSVFVLDADRKSATRRRIKVGRRNAEQLEVLEGLTPGDQVIVSDYTGYDRTDRIILKN